MRVVVFGGRDYSNRDRVYRVLDAAVERLGIREVIAGGATGADTLAEMWAEAHGIPCRVFKAAWRDINRPGAVVKYDRGGRPYDAAAGGARNERMIREGKPDCAIAFPGGSGTADMRWRCERAGIPVYVIPK